MEKPRLAPKEWKAILAQLESRFGTAGMIRIGIEAIGLEGMAKALTFQDPGLTSKDRPRIEAVLKKYMTIKEAMALLVAALGAERVKQILDYLRWREAQERPEQDSGPTVPVPVPGPALPWQDKIKQPMLFVSAPDYWWPTLTGAERAKFLGVIYAAGNITGVDVEFFGKTGAENYIKGINPRRDYEKEYTAQMEAFAVFLADVRSRGLVVSLKFWNANGDSTGKPASWWKDRAAGFVKRFGSDNLLVLAVNERDKATPDATRRAIYEGFIDAGFPRGQLIGYDSNVEYSIVCGYTETHPQKADTSDLKGSTRTHINCTDSGPAISYLYDSWKQLDGVGGKLKTANLESYVKRCRARGTSCSVYSFRQIPDYEMVKVASAAWGGQSTWNVVTPVAGADAIDISGFVGLGPHKGTKPQNIKITRTIKTAKITATALSFTHDPLNWPTNSPIGGNIDGRVFIFWREGTKLTGGHYEWRRPDTRSKDLNNIRKGYLDGKKPPAGARMWICFVNDWTGGPDDRTNVIECQGVWS